MEKRHKKDRFKSFQLWLRGVLRLDLDAVGLSALFACCEEGRGFAVGRFAPRRRRYTSAARRWGAELRRLQELRDRQRLRPRDGAAFERKVFVPLVRRLARPVAAEELLDLGLFSREALALWGAAGDGSKRPSQGSYVPARRGEEC